MGMNLNISQCRLAGEDCSTDVATVWFLTSMAKHMDIQKLAHTECISHIPHIYGISHLCVPSHDVTLQMCL